MSGVSLLFHIEIDPLAPTLATTRLATVCPAAKLSDDALGRGSPVGHVVRYPLASALATVRFTNTALTPCGTPSRPATTSSVVMPARGVTLPLVSSNRAGVSGVNFAGPAGGVGSGGVGSGGVEVT